MRLRRRERNILGKRLRSPDQQSPLESSTVRGLGRCGLDIAAPVLDSFAVPLSVPDLLEGPAVESDNG